MIHLDILLKGCPAGRLQPLGSEPPEPSVWEWYFTATLRILVAINVPTDVVDLVVACGGFLNEVTCETGKRRRKETARA